ncbi:MAG: hypothetical protein AABY28_02695 [Candidatus Omnitrophota bacterium]
MADIVSSAATILSLIGTKKAVKMSKKKPENNRKAEIKRQIKENNIEINKGIFFLPDDLRKLKGKWVLYVIKGMLARLDKKKEK